MIYVQLGNLRNPSCETSISQPEANKHTKRNKPRSLFSQCASMAASVIRDQDPYHLDPTIVGEGSVVEFTDLLY